MRDDCIKKSLWRMSFTGQIGSQVSFLMRTLTKLLKFNYISKVNVIAHKNFIMIIVRQAHKTCTYGVLVSRLRMQLTVSLGPVWVTKLRGARKQNSKTYRAH